MTGLLGNSAPPDANAQDPGQPTPPEEHASETGQPVDLNAMIQQIEEKVPPEMKRDYQAIVVAGMRVMFDEKTHKYMTQAIQEGQSSGQLPRRIVQKIVKLIQIIRQESKGQFKVPMAFPAGIVLLCHALEYIEKTTGKTFSGEVIAAMVKALVTALLHSFNIGPQQLTQGAQMNQQQPGVQPPQAGALPSAAPADAAAPVQGAPPGPAAAL